ncbi:ATP synthase subunit I [Selenihalanaerobacter shriftii]|uniref:ATP synthase I chain n=1 Tax=Selenihalanaerobacter shriftii TaxID=142842 RepID=A0A1T4L0I4_9FIRM|nr:ATP synthase subunit I [Selenihalanaerobacter shriftii]SJZ48153.1 ATP synthase I chain [Selenihalanaerobacter shriftii]
MQQAVRETEAEVRNKVLKVTGFVTIALALSLHTDWLLGYLFGTITSLLMFKLLAITVDEAIEKEFNGARALVLKRYIIRYLIYGVVLYVALQRSYLNLISMLVGLFMVKMVILGDSIYNKFKDYLDSLVEKNY